MIRDERNHPTLAKAIERALMQIQGQANKADIPANVDQPDGHALTFNLSHAETVAVCALSRNRNLGIDVEQIKEELDQKPRSARMGYGA